MGCGWYNFMGWGGDGPMSIFTPHTIATSCEITAESSDLGYE